MTAKPKLRAAAAQAPDGWEVVRFGEIARCIGDRVDDPSKAGVERYVGLEHLDPESLKIRRWGKPTDVEAQKLRFQPGDIIFGKRRAYQKKLAVADFEGICSAHAMVLRANTERIEKDFLPFFMQSDVFFDRALAISVGSLSPTINWSTLAVQEFVLPPRKKQAKIAEVLGAVETAIRASDAAADSQLQLMGCLSRSVFSAPGSHSVSVRDVGSWLSGGTPARGRKDFWTGETPWASPKDMKIEEIFDTSEHISIEAAETGSKMVPRGAILVVVRGMILAHTFPVAITGRAMAFNQDMKALVPSPEFEPEYLLYCFQANSAAMLGAVSDSTHGTKRLTSEDLYSLRVPLLTREAQQGVLTALRACKRVGVTLRDQHEHLKGLRASLLDHFLDSGARYV
jgi:type I restriction enzyme, S subunit